MVEDLNVEFFARESENLLLLYIPTLLATILFLDPHNFNLI
jgi:hypothetical protein